MLYKMNTFSGDGFITGNGTITFIQEITREFVPSFTGTKEMTVSSLPNVSEPVPILSTSN